MFSHLSSRWIVQHEVFLKLLRFLVYHTFLTVMESFSNNLFDFLEGCTEISLLSIL